MPIERPDQDERQLGQEAPPRLGGHELDDGADEPPGEAGQQPHQERQQKRGGHEIESPPEPDTDRTAFQAFLERALRRSIYLTEGRTEAIPEEAFDTLLDDVMDSHFEHYGILANILGWLSTLPPDNVNLHHVGTRILELQELLPCRFRCPKCGEPAKLIHVPHPGDPRGRWRFYHSIAGKPVYHATSVSVPTDLTPLTIYSR